MLVGIHVTCPVPCPLPPFTGRNVVIPGDSRGEELLAGKRAEREVSVVKISVAICMACVLIMLAALA